MPLEKVLSNLKKLKNTLDAPEQKYYSHYRLELEHDRLLKELKQESSDDLSQEGECTLLSQQINVALAQLKKANEKLIKEIEFETECKKLINAGDLNNLKGFINIGEYFGVGKNGHDVSGALDHVLRGYELSAQSRTAKNMPCLDYLCKLLSLPMLVLPKAPSLHPLFSTNKERLQEILAADDNTALMVWLSSASVEDRHFALRVACHKGSMQCLMFLLYQTAPENKHCPIDLLTQGQPSGQCAMHRTIQSGSSMILRIMLDKKFTPSKDLLRQLLVRAQGNKTPIDFLAELKDEDIRSRLVRIIKEVLDKYQKDPTLALEKLDAQALYQKLDALIPKSEKGSRYQFKLSSGYP